MRHALIRLLQLMTLTVFVLGSAIIWLGSPLLNSSRMQQALNHNINAMLNQASSAAYHALHLENDLYLTRLVAQLTQKKSVASASVFSQGGSELSFAFNPNKITEAQRTPEFDQALNQYTPFVKIVLNQDEDAFGFIRIRIDVPQMLRHLHDKHLGACQIEQYYFTLLCTLLLVILELMRMPKSWYRKELRLTRL
jgi:uncharacterized membrane protein affecting hemolysin expression